MDGQNRARSRRYVRLGVVVAVVCVTYFLLPNLPIYYYATREPQVASSFNLAALVLLATWFLVLVRRDVRGGLVVPIVLGFLGGYLASIPAAVYAEWSFQDSLHFVSATFGLLAKDPARALILLTSPAFTGTFLLGGITGLLVLSDLGGKPAAPEHNTA